MACVLAYILVFAHSAVPHDHHPGCGADPAETADRGGHSHYGSCAELGTFLLGDDEFSFDGALCAATVPPFFAMPRLSVSFTDAPAAESDEDIHLPPARPARALRAPPAYA